MKDSAEGSPVKQNDLQGASPTGRAPARVHAFLAPVLLLAVVYSLLGLTITQQISHAELMQRCVLADHKLSRIWSVGNVEIGLSYFGVFGGMLWYFFRAYRRSLVHLTDMGYAASYLVASFVLDSVCVRSLSPFFAMFVGDALVMTFTLLVSRRLWFQRLLGVFIPLIFLTCGLGHLLEGLSYWFRTFPTNVPWTMVTADIGFAVLVNSSRFPAFIRGEDIVNELAIEKSRAMHLQQQVAAREEAERENARLHLQVEAEMAQRGRFMRHVLSSVTEGRLRFCIDRAELPDPPPGAQALYNEPLTRSNLHTFRQAVRKASVLAELPPEREADLLTAAGEASMNAVVHARDGVGAVYADHSAHQVLIWIEDHGGGISMENLPMATLERGFTTAGTLGHGFWLMLQTADEIYLLTGATGTIIALVQNQVEADPAWLVQAFKEETSPSDALVSGM